MNKEERKLANTVWSYLRDHANTPEGKAIFASLGKVIRADLERRDKRNASDKKGEIPCWK